MTAPPATDPDATLVARFLRERSDRAFTPLYSRHSGRVYGLVVRLLGPLRDQADDAFQETWVRAVQRLPEFEWRARFSTWLCGIAVNCCREIRRRHGSEGRESGDATGRRGSVDQDERAGPAEPAARLDLADALDLGRAIQDLAPGYRDVLVLHDLHGFTHEEIGALLGVEPGTSKSQLSRARRAVRQVLLDGAQQPRAASGPNVRRP